MAVTTSLPAAALPSDYPSTVLFHHNLHRANHSAPAQSYDNTLASYAASVAASCTFAHNITLGGGGYGQNIAAYGSTLVATYTPEQMGAFAVSNQWYNSEFNAFLPSYYGEATPDMTNFESWGHFSQVVWKASTLVGCATQFCAAGTIFPTVASYYSVCNYGGPGNVETLYGLNIGSPLGEATVSEAL
jgi:hypothetical protein